MHHDREVLHALRTRFSASELTQVVGRLLRVPEAWRALRNPAFLHEVIAADPPVHLTPSHLATLALGGEITARIDPELAVPHAQRSERLWQQAMDGSVDHADLFDTALLGLRWAQEFEEDPSLIGAAAVRPRLWRSPLAVAWPALHKPEHLLAGLLEAGARQLAQQVALANLPAEEAVSYLLRNANGTAVGLLLELWRAANAELPIAPALPKAVRPNQGEGLVALLSQALDLHYRGEGESAKRILAQAWDSATQATAQIAEFTADLARAEGDTVTEAEANQRALEALPTPQRRARTARSLARLGRSGEAHSLLSATDPTVVERVASACLHYAQDGAHQDSGALRRAADTLLASPEPVEHEWYLELCGCLQQAGELEAAIEVGQAAVEAFPASAAARRNLAELFGTAGDWEACATQGALAQVLGAEVGGLLARALEQLGDFKAALPVRRQLNDGDPQSLVSTAIAAGDLDLAGSVVEQMLTEHPDSVSGHLALGRVLAAKGQQASAGAAFQEALARGPQRIDALLALAEWQRQQGETDHAGRTLMQAAQLEPHSAPAQAALAAWLDSVGRTSEAIDAAARAAAAEVTSIEQRLLHARLLAKLGHLEQARGELQQAARRAPRDWRVRLAMAELLEHSGELAAAARQVETLPKSAGAADWLALGRIGVQAGTDLHAAMHALTVAEEQGCDEAALHYWVARGLEQLGRYQAASERYADALERLGSADYDLREQATLGLARCELQSGRISAALEVLEAAREQYGGGARILALTAQVYRSADLPDKAIEVAQAAVDLDADDPAGWEALSVAQAAAGDFEAACAAAEQHSRLAAGSIAPWLAVAQMAAEDNQPPLARKALARALWRGRGDPGSLASAAQQLSDLGFGDSAIRVMRAAVGRAPQDAALRQRMAGLLEACGAYELAQQAWMDCAAVAPDDDTPLRKAARCAAHRGKTLEAIQLLEQARTIRPQSPGLRRQLAAAYAAHGDVARSIQAYAGALREAPNDVSLAMEAAEAALQAGSPREALGFVGRAQQLIADEGRVQAALGEGYLLLNEHERAADALQGAVDAGVTSGRVLAMLSLVRPEFGADPQALADLKAESAHDAIWIARAYRNRLEFDRALEVLARWKTDRRAAVELARSALRARDAAWVLQYADHGASADLAQLEREVVRSMGALLEMQLDPELLTPLRAWQEADRLPERLRDHAAGDLTGELGEAWIIAHLRAGALDDAMAAVDWDKQSNPEAPWLLLLDGISQEIAGFPERARAAYRGAEGRAPIAPIARYLLGRSYMAAGEFKRAASHIGKAAAQWMQVPAWQFRLGQAYLELDEPDSALSHFQSAASLAPENHGYQLALAKAYRVCGHLMQAESAFTAALAAEQVSANTYRLAGQVALEIGRPDLAAERFERACELDPQDPLAHVGAATAAAAQGDRPSAEKHLRAAVQLDPERPEVLLGQGQVLLQTGKSAAAMQAFERALQAGADPAQVYRSQSKLLLQTGQSEQAVAPLRKALELDPQDDSSWHELALALEAQSDLAAADEAVGQALRAAPRNPEYRLTLARVARRSGNLDRALEELRTARKLVSNDPRPVVEVGLVHEERREYSRALDAYREAIEIDGACLEAYYRAGLLLRTLKAYRRAGEMLKHAAELAPINQDVLHQLAAVRALELVHG